MTSRLGLFAATLGGLLAVLGPGAHQPNDAARIAPSFDRIEAQLLQRPDVTEALSPGREELVVLIKKYPRAARSWQLSPSLALEMSDKEIFNFVTLRANRILACGIVALSEDELRKGGQGAPVETESPPIAPRFWEGPTVEGKVRISPDCSTLIDESGQPYTVSTREELQWSEKLLLRFNPAKMSILPRAPAASQRLQQNIEYLHSEHGGGPEPEPRLDAILGQGSRVFSRQVLVFRAYIRATAAQERLILLLPLSV